MNRMPVFFVAALCAAHPFFSDARAADIYRADYSISLLGLRVAKSQFETTVDHDTYRITGSLHSAGLARIFEKVDGTTNVAGRMSARGIMPVSYSLRYHYGKESASRAIHFRDGAVADTRVEPPEKRKKRWIEVSPDDLKAVADPFTSVLIAAASPREVCQRTLRIYDGATRIDLKLDFAGWQPFSTQGFKGTATSCRVQFIPVAGYRKGTYAMRYLSKDKRIRISFASLGNSGIYAPVFAKVGTQVGDVTVYATRFEKVTGQDK